jgi:hypothetical protein
MELPKVNRLLAVTKWLQVQRGLSMAEVGQLLGYKNNTHFSQVVHRPQPIPEGVVEKIVSLDPRINRDYLEGRSENMLIQENEGGPGDVITPQGLAQIVSDLTGTIREQQATIREQNAMLRTLIEAHIGHADE